MPIMEEPISLNIGNQKGVMSCCVGCGGPIQDQYILRVAPDLEWHASCLKCADCNTYLDETCTCYVREGQPYCKRDYLRLFGTKCAKCSQGFSKNDCVMRARNKIYHIDCFRCLACARQLIPGDEFALRENGLFCKADHDVLERTTPDATTVMMVNNNNNGNHQNFMNSPHTLTDISQPTTPHPKRSTVRSSSHHGGSDRGGKAEKSTRVRTVLNEKQLHTLMACYNANPRPDALMKEQLVEMTGLSQRVIRVWFQNHRCKDKKRREAIMQNGVDKHGGKDRRMQSFNGVPMVASSPVRNDTPMQGTQVEVQSYQPPWKALSDFALSSDIDQPPFQQLVSFSEQTLDGSEPLRGDTPGSGMSLPPTPDSSDDRISTGHGMLEPLSVGSE